MAQGYVGTAMLAPAYFPVEFVGALVLARDPGTEVQMPRKGRTIVGPGLPAFCDGDGRFHSGDCLRVPAA